MGFLFHSRRLSAAPFRGGRGLVFYILAKFFCLIPLPARLSKQALLRKGRGTCFALLIPPAKPLLAKARSFGGDAS